LPAACSRGSPRLGEGGGEGAPGVEGSCWRNTTVRRLTHPHPARLIHLRHQISCSPPSPGRSEYRAGRGFSSMVEQELPRVQERPENVLEQRLLIRRWRRRTRGLSSRRGTRRRVEQRPELVHLLRRRLAAEAAHV